MLLQMIAGLTAIWSSDQMDGGISAIGRKGWRMMMVKFILRILKICMLLTFLTSCNFPLPSTTLFPEETGTAAANLAETPIQPTETATPTPIATKTLRPTPSQTLAPTAVPSDLVWFAPNMGSRDYVDLFTKPEKWTAARRRLDVFKFYTQNLLDTPCTICGSNVLSAFADVDAFHKLANWGIAIGVEVGTVKERGCTGDEEFRVAKEVMDNVQTNGGKVTFLAMDEPYISGELVANGISCNHTMEQSADATSHFTQLIMHVDAQVLVGDIEPYPYFSAYQLEAWITALEERSVELAFFHLDIDIERASVEGQNVEGDLQALSQFCQEHGIPFGVIFTSNWRYAGSDRAYYDSTMGWINSVHRAIGKPQHVIFQSWQGPDREGVHSVPINLPEDDVNIYSHTRLILAGMEVLLK
jgi:hypothetical protein